MEEINLELKFDSLTNTWGVRLQESGAELVLYPSGAYEIKRSRSGRFEQRSVFAQAQ